SWTGLQPSTIEIAVSGSAQEVNSTIRDLQRALPLADVRPVPQIVEGETRVLGKMRSTLLASALLIILTAALCLLATLTEWVFDRRRDFAIMKRSWVSVQRKSSLRRDDFRCTDTHERFGFLLRPCCYRPPLIQLANFVEIRA